jgi:hypothetical protein
MEGGLDDHEREGRWDKGFTSSPTASILMTIHLYFPSDSGLSTRGNPML